MNVLPKKRSGFTLIETLIVMSIFSLVFVVLFSGFSSGMRVWRAFSKGGIATNRQMWLGLEKVSRDIRSSFACEGIEFEGDEDSFSFPSARDYEVSRVEYFYKKGRKTLYCTRTTYADLLEERESDVRKEVFTADKLEFSYLYYDPIKEAFYWTTEWILEDESPKAVRLKLKSDGKEIEKTIFIPTA